MDNWTDLAALLIGIINTLIIPWTIWVTREIYQLKAGLALNISHDKERNKKFDELLGLIKELHHDNKQILLALAARGIEVKSK